MIVPEKTKQHHVLDTKTGKPTTEIISTTVIAQQTRYADALATTAMILGANKGVSFLDTHRNVTGFQVDQNGQLYFCKNWNQEICEYA